MLATTLNFNLAAMESSQKTPPAVGLSKAQASDNTIIFLTEANHATEKEILEKYGGRPAEESEWTDPISGIGIKGKCKPQPYIVAFLNPDSPDYISPKQLATLLHASSLRVHYVNNEINEKKLTKKLKAKTAQITLPAPTHQIVSEKEFIEDDFTEDFIYQANVKNMLYQN